MPDSTDRPKIRGRERQALVQALRAGVVPRAGLHHIQVGRSAELKPKAVILTPSFPG